jgi:hypothetical protein
MSPKRKCPICLKRYIYSPYPRLGEFCEECRKDWDKYSLSHDYDSIDLAIWAAKRTNKIQSRKYNYIRNYYKDLIGVYQRKDACKDI